MDETNSRAKIFYNFSVLKLGQVNLSDYTFFGGRNLDFVDMDSIHITGKWHGSFVTKINFSSCRKWIIESCDNLHHFYFNKCNVENFNAIDSRIYDFHFEDCNVRNPCLRGSYVNGLSYKNVELSNPIIERCEIERFEYDSANWNNYKQEEDNCRRYRSAFQNMGKRDEARKFYYQERCFNRKNLFKLQSIKSKLLYLVSLIEYLLWGYGEKPLRIILNALSLILIYAILYYGAGPSETKQSIINSIYFSVVTFTTLGYGDIKPGSDIVKLICSSEAIIGAFLLGLIIAGFSNRARY